MMARREQMWMPGVPRSPFPDGWTHTPPRRKPRRIAATRSAPHTRVEVFEVPSPLGIMVGTSLSVVRPRKRADREPGRPVTYDHPLALAARAGRKHALWRGPEPTFATAEERRAFEVARARRLAWRRGER
jgi:hypothetical protein